MVRARLWFRCAAVGDPVSPIQVSPATLGWEAKQRQVDLVIERDFNGEELLRRMKGWITVDPAAFIETARSHGRIKVLDGRTLVIECPDPDTFDTLKAKLDESFPGKVDLEPMSGLA